MIDLSIIIPVKKGESSWRKLLSQLKELHINCETILIGPDFENQTEGHIQFIYSQKGRAGKLNEGALKAKGRFLWFLHADSKISKNSSEVINLCLKKNPDAIYHFDLYFLTDGPRLLTLNSIGANVRSKVFKMPFGDQAFFLRKNTFINLGLFDEMAPYGEDHLLIWRAHQNQIKVQSCNTPIYTSARKYQKDGWIKTTLTHIFLTYKQAFPELLKMYRPQKSSAVAIFVKTPGLSPLKTRLAEKIGKEKAEEFFNLSLKATEAIVVAAIKEKRGKFKAYWAVSEAEALEHALWSSFSTIAQGDGGLGERLDHIYKTLLNKHDKVFLIGADLPHLPYSALLQADQQLESDKDFVMGKTEDGGFYLLGGKKSISKEIWTSVTYSSDQTAGQLENLLKGSHLSYLPVEFDVDYEEDLRKIASTQFKTNLLPEQHTVISWVKNFLG